MARYSRSLILGNDTLVTQNAFPLNRQADSLNTCPRITKSPSNTKTQRYIQRPSTIPLRRKTILCANTCKRASQQRRFNSLAALLLHSYYLDI